ncbi:hypothetical protein QR685DRAFT_527740 [Neurospora intermedia]|uniref:Cyanovirin-N domain-containing protein n=1 Tax=Neurospora intermedia TaxID=5142 RepID=A0ABR3DAY1_NEUIN
MKSPTLTSISFLFLAQTATVHCQNNTKTNTNTTTTDPVITSLRSFTELYCDEQHWSTGYTLSRSQATGTCIGLYDSRSLTVGFLDARCHVTVYTEQGCQDPGVVIGVDGCFSDEEKGLKGYKVDCRWW